MKYDVVITEFNIKFTEVTSQIHQMTVKKIQLWMYISIFRILITFQLITPSPSACVPLCDLPSC